MTLDSRTRWLALYVLCLGDLMIVLDGTIVNVALPTIQDDLGFSETSLAWVVNAYLLTFGGFLLLGGRLGDLFGQRKLFLTGSRHFTAASLACGLADLAGAARRDARAPGPRRSAGRGGRALPGHDAVRRHGRACEGDGHLRLRALGRRSRRRARSAGSSPTSSNWHWIFLVNIPVGAAVFVLSLRLLPPVPGTASGRLDIGGAVTVTAALMLAVYAIVNGNDTGWLTAQTLGLLGAAIALLAVFLAIEARIAAPLMPLDSFRNRSVSSANVIATLMAARDVRLLLLLGALHAAGPRLQPARGRPRLPAREPCCGARPRSTRTSWCCASGSSRRSSPGSG